MKRQLLFLVLAGGLALMTAPIAIAGTAAPGYCGHNYAMLMQGTEPNPNPAQGSSAGYTGALTGIVGVGVIQFSAGCRNISGELIYNDGDIQFTVTGIGAFAGPAACYSSESILAGLPCFDGGNHFSAASVTTAGAPPGMSLLQFTANFNFYDLGLESSPTGSMPFAFTIQETAGDSILVGTTVPSPTAPVLTLTMQEQSPYLVKIPTTFGEPPYAGVSAIVCTGTGADDDDLIAEISNNDSGGVAGSYGSAVGSVQILSSPATGILSFNTNDNLQVAGSTQPVSNNTACNFSEIPDPYDGPATFADGTSNLWSTITSAASDPTCTNANSAGGGFTTSQVAWGASDQNSYAMVTGLTETSFPFIPPGEMSTCTHFAVAPATVTL
jgi:hypothetical protein